MIWRKKRDTKSSPDAAVSEDEEIMVDDQGDINSDIVLTKLTEASQQLQDMITLVQSVINQEDNK